MVAPHLTIKAREARALMESPIGDLRSVEVRLTGDDGSDQTFSTIKEAREVIGKTFGFLRSDHSINIRGADGVMYTMERTLKVEDADAIKAQREAIGEKLKQFHHSPHDSLEHIKELPDAYVAGIMDGDGCYDVHGKNSQHHSLTARCRELPDLFQRCFNGTVGAGNKECTKYVWTIHSRQGADEFLERIAPFVVGKKKQVELILNMEKGGADRVHRELSLLKGANMPVTKQPKVYKNPPKELPTGVHPNGAKYIAMLRHNNHQYSLGTFATVEKATEAYKKYNDIRNKEITDGIKAFDWASLLAKNRPQEPDTFDPSKRAKYVYHTASRTYQVKILNKGRNYSCGTFKIFEDALEARDKWLNEHDIPIPA